jgi:hypothetical protein
MQHISEVTKQFMLAVIANAKQNGHEVPEKILNKYTRKVCKVKKM